METAARIEVLAGALKAVLGAAFEDEMRTLVENEAWYSPAIPAEELFRLHVQDQFERSPDGLWVFSWVRTSERKFLAEKLGLDRPGIVGRSSTELAEKILGQVGLPVSRVSGLRRLVEVWSTIGEVISAGEDERAAVLARQKAERLLRLMLFFHCSTGHSGAVLRMIADPGTLRVPQRLQAVVKVHESNHVPTLLTVLREDGWADLGFLVLALRKISAALEKSGVRLLAGGELTLMTGTEYEVFRGLSEALQAYAHDTPSAREKMKERLGRSVDDVRKAVDSMLGRGILPDEMLVLENCDTLMGPVCRGLLEGGRERRLVTASPPSLGSRILFLASAPRDYARCLWTESPWKD